MSNLLRLGLLLSFLLLSDYPALSDELEEGKVKPMFEDGKFKCSDGYDPDTDPSLHPPGQDPRSRELVNAQAQAEHEKKAAEQRGNEEGGASKTDAGVRGDSAEKMDKSLSPEKKDGKEPEKKEQDKKDEKKDEKKDDKKEDKSRSGTGNFDMNKAASPMNRALFAIQSKNYQASADLLNTLLKSDVKNAQAHYLLAVSYVGLRRYGEARDQYNVVLKSAADPKLLDMARSGLQRISGSAGNP